MALELKKANKIFRKEWKRKCSPICSKSEKMDAYYWFLEGWEKAKEVK